MAAKNNETGSRALAVTKNNLSGDKHTRAYDIVSKGDSSVVAWGEVLTTSADELANQEPPKKKRGPPPAKLDAAIDILRDILQKGPVRVDDVFRCAKSAGISRTMVYEARDALRVQKVTLEMRAAWRLHPTSTPDIAVPVGPETPDNSGQSLNHGDSYDY